MWTKFYYFVECCSTGEITQFYEHLVHVKWLIHLSMELCDIMFRLLQFYNSKYHEHIFSFNFIHYWVVESKTIQSSWRDCTVDVINWNRTLCFVYFIARGTCSLHTRFHSPKKPKKKENFFHFLDVVDSISTLFVVFHFIERFRFYLQNLHQIERVHVSDLYLKFRMFIHYIIFSECVRRKRAHNSQFTRKKIKKIIDFVTGQPID